MELCASLPIDPMGNGPFKQLPMTIPSIPLCMGMKEFIKKYSYPSVIKGVNTDFPFDGSECPIRKGKYYVKNMLVDPAPFPVIVPRGFLKSVFYLTHGKAKLGVTEFVVEIRNRVF
ncbi:uncharacterized protein Dwil_GK27812 [Drosophila willistoni]|uniref:MD-2-related lipid-recognition domain-containing protein n=1 Tax=Drosophila willistoni TaxID=7260 RepID=A0A0Q9X821_DROWI|nr:uncharacterized protein Dwil_GK27812 [Drosophila willistoni]